MSSAPHSRYQEQLNVRPQDQQAAEKSTAAVDLSDLRTAIRGNVSVPGDVDFERLSMPWDLTVNQSVHAVAEVADTADACALVRFARDNEIAIAAQPNGHGATETLNGTVLVRTRRMNEIRVDPQARSVRVGAGVSWGAVLAAGESFNLIGASGSSPVVGVAGYTLGGGLSWFSRSFGWAADSVIAYEAISAEGDAIHVTADSASELFWALRGGGGDYALVTALEFALHPLTSLYGGSMLWPAAKASDVLTAFRDVTATAPDGLSVWCGLANLPGMEPFVGIYSTYLGSSDPKQSWLRPLEKITGRFFDSHRKLRPAELGTITNEPTDPSPLIQRGTLLTSLDDASMTELFTKPIAPLSFIQIRHLGGALARGSDSPAGQVAEPYYITLGGVPTAELAATEIGRHITENLGMLSPIDGGRTLFTFLAPEQEAAEAFDGPTLARLRDAKRRYDPRSVFRSNHPVLA